MNDRANPEDTPWNVLLVGATPRDARVVNCGLAREDVSMDIAEDVRAAIDRLTLASKERTKVALPDLIALDLTTAPSEGLTVLRALQASPRLWTLPTVALVEQASSADDPQDCVQEAYECGVNGHVSKSDNAEEFADAVQQMAAFWFGRVSFPPESLYSGSTSIDHD